MMKKQLLFLLLVMLLTIDNTYGAMKDCSEQKEKTQRSEDLNKRLFEAAKNGNVVEFRRLINCGASVNAKDEFEATPLHIAAKYGRLDVVKEVIARDPDVDAKNMLRQTPLHMAAYGGHLDVVQELIAHGYSVNARCQGGNTVLHWAADSNHLHVVQELVAFGANFDRTRYQNNAYVLNAIDEGLQRQERYNRLVNTLTNATAATEHTTNQNVPVDLLGIIAEYETGPVRNHIHS